SESAQTSACCRPCGTLKSDTGALARAPVINACQICPAPATPRTSFIGLLFVFPTQTPVTRSGVKPTTHESRYSSVVPVLTAAGRFGKTSGLLAPYVGWRALSSARIDVIWYTRRRSATWAPFGRYSYSTLPLESGTLRID